MVAAHIIGKRRLLYYALEIINCLLLSSLACTDNRHRHFNWLYLCLMIQ